jgi:glutamyl-tRNA reductase
MSFRSLSLTYRTAPISVREKTAFVDSEARGFLMKLKDVFGVEEALLLSTCNRTELYYTSKEDISDQLIGLIASEKGQSSATLRHNFKTKSERDAIEHLFRVALGLDSQVVGDIQISNQVKRAYQASADLQMAGPFLHRLMHTIFFANKRVVQETCLQDGNASVASVAVDLINAFSMNVSNPRVLLIGLGEIGQNVLENLSNMEGVRLTVVNRTKEKAIRLVSNPSIIVGDYDNLDKIIEESDVVISAVSVTKPIIGHGLFDEKHNHKLLIDLSLPRSIEPEIDQLPGVSLYNIDQLIEKTQKAKDRRIKAIPDAEKIIQDAIIGFDAWRGEMEVSPTIQKLKESLDSIRKEELSKYAGKISDKEEELLSIATKNMIQKMIKLPVIQLKAACKRGEAETLVEVLNDLFNLEGDKVINK